MLLTESDFAVLMTPRGQILRVIDTAEPSSAVSLIQLSLTPQ